MDSRSPSAATAGGYVFVISAALLWGVSGSAAKFLFQSGMTPFQLVQVRLTLTAAGLLLWLALRHPSLLKIDRSDIGYFAVFGVVGMAGVQFTYLFAISKIQVAAAMWNHGAPMTSELAERGIERSTFRGSELRDLVAFLVYMGEPIQLERQRLGIWVILFLLGFLVLAYFLKKEYWKDVH